jgi:hypothetical protein
MHHAFSGYFHKHFVLMLHADCKEVELDAHRKSLASVKILIKSNIHAMSFPSNETSLIQLCD